MALTETATAKTVAMVVLFITSTVLGLTPLLITNLIKFSENPNSKNNLYVRLMLGFGGGVLLCTTFIHLLPEVTEKIEEINEPAFKINNAELLMCIGFLLMYLVEESVHYYIHRKQHQTTSDNGLNNTKVERTLTITSEENPHLEMGKKPQKGNHEENHHQGHSHFQIDDNEEDSFLNVIRGLLIVLALSIHELFEGLAVGLETKANNVWYMFGAVSAHKLVIAFCIGFELVSLAIKKHLVMIYIITFAIVSPLGIGIGIFLSWGSGESSTDFPSVILQGLASGTLLYVVFFEILRDERKAGLRQFLAVTVGFLVMLGISFIKE